MLWHLHLRREHSVIFRNIKSYDPEAESFVLTRRAQGASIPKCEVGQVLKSSGHYFQLWRWIGNQSHTFGDIAGDLAYLVRRRTDGPPADLYAPTRIEWLRLAEMAIWYVYGYDLTSIYSVDWTLRATEWKLGQDPRSRRNGRMPIPSQLPVDPCDLLDGPEHPL